MPTQTEDSAKFVFEGTVKKTKAANIKSPANQPSKTFDPYLEDYAHLLSVGKDFYGILSASNLPDMTHFPVGVTFQRNADFNKRKLLDIDNVTAVDPSIDPFFFKATG